MSVRNPNTSSSVCRSIIWSKSVGKFFSYVVHKHTLPHTHRHYSKHFIILSVVDDNNNTIRKSSVSTERWIFSETTLGGCSGAYWTAGQRRDPTSNSTFIWRRTPLDTDDENDAVTEMRYTNWADGQPNYLNEHESCMDMLADREYTWADVRCNGALCSVCELDLTSYRISKLLDLTITPTTSGRDEISGPLSRN